MYDKDQLIPPALIRSFNYAKMHSPFYREFFKGIDVPVNYDTWSRLPFTTKENLAERNEDFCAVERSRLAELATTSGTSGAPVTLYLTKNDLNRLATNEKMSFELAGITPGSLIQLMTTIDRQFMAGLAYYLGAQELGCGMIRTGPGLPELQWASIEKYKPDYLIAVPSFLLILIQYAEQAGIELNKSGIKGVVCIGEAIRTADLKPNILHQRITEKWDIELFSTYASTELSTAFTECKYGCGGHLNEDLLFLEVLNEEGGQVSDGEEGELVFSHIGVEGTPLIRYKTGDLARVYYKPCPCGRTSPRLGPISGRKNQLIKFRGTSVYPQAIFGVLDAFEDLPLYKVVVARDENDLDQLTLLLPENIKDSKTQELIETRLIAQIKVRPLLEFHTISYLRSQVYKRELRKPERIEFKLKH